MEHARQALVVRVRVDVLEPDELPVGALLGLILSALSLLVLPCQHKPLATAS